MIVSKLSRKKKLKNAPLSQMYSLLMKSFLFSRKLSTKNWTQEILTVEWMTPYLKVPRVVSCFKFLDLHPLLSLLSPFHLIPTFSLSSWLSYLLLFSFAICIIILFSSMQSKHCDLHHMWLHCETNKKLSFLSKLISNTNYVIYDSLISQGESEGEIDLDTLEILCEVQEVSHEQNKWNNNVIHKSFTLWLAL